MSRVTQILNDGSGSLKLAPMLKNVWLVVVVMLGVACSPTYGQQKCKTSTECGGSHFCLKNCTSVDAGPGVDVSGTCRKPCTADSDCGDLGLKKPFCASDLCGNKACYEAPF